MTDPRAVLGSIPGFGGAEPVSRRSDGPTNESWLVEQGGEQFVLRLDKPETALLGLDRDSEKAVCEALAAAGLGHPPVHFDPDAGVYLRRYVPGRSWTMQDLQSPGKLERLAELLRRVHALPPAGQKFKPLKAAGRYARQIGGADAGNLFLEAATAYALIEPGTPALCHNDLFCGNVIEGEELSLIDWEYAGIGDPFFDLAVVVRHHDLEDELARHFLGAYLGKKARKKDMARLEKQCRFYGSLLKLWNLRIKT